MSDASDMVSDDGDMEADLEHADIGMDDESDSSDEDLARAE